MRVLIWLLLIATLAVGLAITAHYNQGYALFILPPWRMEISLNLLLVLLVGGFILSYLALRGIFVTLGLPAQVSAWRIERRQKKAEAALREAVLLWLAGRYARALSNAEMAWQAGHAQELAALIALANAHALRDSQKIVEWRKRTMVHDDQIHGARLLLEAELAIEARNHTEALVLLNQLTQDSGRHIVAMRLALRAHRAVGHWDQVVHLARQLEKHHVLSNVQTAPLIVAAHRQRLKDLERDGHSLATYWEKIPAAERRAPGLAVDAARAMLAANQHAAAQQVIEDGLDEEWNSELAALYGDCAGNDALGRIARAEGWLLSHPRDAALLLTLGRLCLQKQLWGKAQSYLEASLSQKVTRAAHVELAQLFDKLGQAEQANRHYRKAATISPS